MIKVSPFTTTTKISHWILTRSLVSLSRNHFNALAAERQRKAHQERNAHATLRWCVALIFIMMFANDPSIDKSILNVCVNYEASA